MLAQKKLCQIPSSCSVTFLARKESPFVNVAQFRQLTVGDCNFLAIVAVATRQNIKLFVVSEDGE